ncbi:hypothetical protein BaRGS_00005689 [Batillaria attramentaria]|uniref:RING-type domain-containing protein n=1 Tax=Batillaria attramentaria TaxID=370345 RepID=A0ABD0LUK0_9CAEN
MSKFPSGRDIGPDEDRHMRRPDRQQSRSVAGRPVANPTEDSEQRVIANDLHHPDLEEDNAEHMQPRPFGHIRGRPGYWFHEHEPVDANPASEAEIYESVFPQRQHVPVTAEYYKSEENRLQTFGDWPRTAPVRKEDLARNGFIYTGSNDKVRCVYCNGVLRQWEQGDVVEQEHQRNYAQCPFVRGDDVGNIPFRPSVNGHHSEPADMSRSSSSDCGQERSGYDIGPDEDRCGLRPNAPPHPSLNGWTQSFNNTARGSGVGGGDNVVGQSGGASEHRTYSSRPRNPVMAAEPDRLETFESWPAQMKQRPEQLSQAGLYYIGDSDKTKCFHCDGLLYNWEPDDDPFVEHARWFPQCQYIRLIKGDDFVSNVQSGKVQDESVLQTPAVLAVLSEGHSVEKVQRAINALKEREGASVVITATKLLETVMDLDTQWMDMHSHVPDSLASSADVEQLQKENESLRDKQLCKICMERDVEVIFYPCKHFVCCAMCGTAVSSCPICRQPIQSVDKVFMA